VLGSIAAAASSFCTTCSGSGTSPSFCWEVTTNDANLANSGGCSVGDSTGTLGSQATFIDVSALGKTGYAVQVGATTAGGYDNYTFDVSSDDLFDDQQGTVQLDFYIPSTGGFVASTRLWGSEPEANQDRVYIILSGTDELAIYHEGANGGNDIAATTSANIGTNTWYTVIAKWRVGTSPYLSIECNGDTQTYTTSDLTAFDTAATNMGVGNIGSAIDGYAYIKNVKIWKTWQ
jgi:hypothetical protein